MKYWVTNNNKAYWRGEAKDMPPGAQEVPPRPAPDMDWDGNVWVKNPALSKEMVQGKVFAELQRLEKFKLFSKNIQVIADLTLYLPQIESYYDNANVEAKFPVCPDSLLDINFEF